MKTRSVNTEHMKCDAGAHLAEEHWTLQSCRSALKAWLISRDCSGPPFISYTHIITQGHDSGADPAASCPITDLQGRTEEVLCTGPWLGMSFCKLDVNEASQAFISLKDNNLEVLEYADLMSLHALNNTALHMALQITSLPDGKTDL